MARRAHRQDNKRYGRKVNKIDERKVDEIDERKVDEIDGRKSDEIENGEKKSRAASYVRLSKGEKGNSIVQNSIAHQKAVIREYVKKQQDIQIIREFEDCNRSGTNFDRAGFFALIEAVERKEIDCVIVKDLSRFGRNLHEVSEYLELKFPRLGVRFISVLDGYDSKKPECMGDSFLLQMKCLLHERYAKDVSLKIHTTVKLMQKSGKIFGSVPYGYQKEKTGKVNITEAAEGVRFIYQLALMGMGNQAIASEMDKCGYAPPSEYQRTGMLKKEEYFGEDGRKKNEKNGIKEDSKKENCVGGRLWQASSIGRILNNTAYIGTGICHKSRQCFYKGEKRRKVEKEEWIYLDHIYPAIITKDVFEKVQEMRHKNRHQNRRI